MAPDRPAVRWRGGRVERKCDLRLGQRPLAAEIAGALARPVDDDARDGLARERSGIDDLERASECPRQHRDRRPAGRKIVQHLHGDFRRKRRDTLRRDAVIAGKQQDWHPLRARRLRRLQRGEVDRHLFQPAQRATRLGEPVLPRERGLPVPFGGRGTVEVDPFWQHDGHPKLEAFNRDATIATWLPA